MFVGESVTPRGHRTKAFLSDATVAQANGPGGGRRLPERARGPAWAWRCGPGCEHHLRKRLPARVQAGKSVCPFQLKFSSFGESGCAFLIPDCTESGAGRLMLRQHCHRCSTESVAGDTWGGFPGPCPLTGSPRRRFRNGRPRPLVSPSSLHGLERAGSTNECRFESIDAGRRNMRRPRQQH